MIQLHIAPLQGLTDAAWCHFHSMVYGAGLKYYTPFIRLERNDIRTRDMHNLMSPLNKNLNLSAQVIFKDAAELSILLDKLHKDGIRKFDLNMGCPFPLQVAKGRGSAFIANSEQCALIPDILRKYNDSVFSLKMRLGQNSPDEWEGIAGSINGMPLTHVTLHPRIGKQQYSGEINIDMYARFLDKISHSVVYNGNIRTPDDITAICEKYPETAGVMAARGLVARPSLFTEYLDQEKWSHERRMEYLLRFHRLLLNHYSESLCGDHQILSKIKPFWEYSEDEIGRKAWKSIRKASNMAKYHSAVAMIE